MGRIVLHEAMRLKPYKCTSCGGTPRDEEGNNLPACFVEGVDVNWGDSLYICDSCVRVMGQLIGMETVENSEKLRRKLSEVETELKQEKDLHEELKDRVDRMIDGKKAVQEVKKTRPKRKVAA